MNKYKVPQDDRRFSQLNEGDVGGNLWLTQNIDFKSNKGKIRVSPRLIINSSSSDDADLGRVSALSYFVSKFWAVCGSVIFKSAGDDPDDTFSQDNIASTPTDLDYRYSDINIAPNGMLVSNVDNVYLLNSSSVWSSWWKTTLSQSFTNASTWHTIEIMYNTTIALSDLNKINTVVFPYSSSENVTKPKITLRTEDYILWIRSSSTRVWIGTINGNKGEGLVYEWDGSSSNTSRAYKIGATGALAGVIKDDIPYIITSDGSLKKFIGAGFTTIAQLPHTSSSYMLDSSILSGLSDGNTRWIHPNGMKLIDGNINILINNLLEESIDYTHLIENEPSGIWEYDEQIGLYHKYLFTLDSTGSLDSGQNCIGYAGVLLETKKPESSLICGASVYTDNGLTLKHAIFHDELPNTLAKVGFIVTPWMQSSDIEDVWQKIWVKFKDFDNVTDKIIVKYRTRKDKDMPVVYDATWTSSTIFTITSSTDLEATTNILDVGNEVEVIMASGAGKSAHISSVSATGTYIYTIILDEAILATSGTGKVRFNNFKKIETIDTQNITNKVMSLAKNEIELQIKLELRGTGDNPEINQLVVLSGSQLPIK